MFGSLLSGIHLGSYQSQLCRSVTYHHGLKDGTGAPLPRCCSSWQREMGECRWRDESSFGPTFGSLSATSRLTSKGRYKVTEANQKCQRSLEAHNGSNTKVSLENSSSSLRSLERQKSHSIQPKKLTTETDLVITLSSQPSLLKLSKRRPREVKRYAQGHTAIECQSWTKSKSNVLTVDQRCPIEI